MVVMGVIFYPILKKVYVANENRKQLLFYANMAIKMVLSLLLILVVALCDKENAIPFAAIFFVFYVFLIFFETRCFMKVTKISQTNKQK